MDVEIHGEVAQVLRVLKDEEFLGIHKQRLAEFPLGKLDAALKAVHDMVSVEDAELIRKEFDSNPSTWWSGHHHGWGTAVRNGLRGAGITDDQLPSMNWDDYYIPIVEIALGLREDPRHYQVAGVSVVPVGSV